MDEEILIKETPGCTKGIWFVPMVYYNDTDTKAFKDWTKNITYCGYVATLPNGSTINCRMFIDLVGQYDPGAYANALRTFYETNG